VSATGTLVYVPGSFRFVPKSVPIWIDRRGVQVPIGVEPHQFLYPRLSPDGTRLAVSVRDQFEAIWMWDFGRRTLSRITNTGIRENYPVWMPDGKQLIYSVSRGGNADLWIQAADGSGPPTQLTQSAGAELGTSVTPDGTRLIFQDPNNGVIRMMDLTRDKAVEPLLVSRFTQLNGEVSPNGRWIAYESNESGQFEVYVRPFPEVDRSRQPISSGGGRQPLWSRDGRELFFLTPNGRLMRVPVVTADSWRAGTPEHLFDGPSDLSWAPGISGRLYDISPDGRRFLFLKPAPDAEQPQAPSSIIVVQHWTSELARARAEQLPAP
jgi:serine/threonine-protein kinase